MTDPGKDRFFQEFVIEAQEHLTAIEPDLLALEAGGASCEAEVINRIFRAMHSIKGGAGLLGCQRVQELSHAMEALVMRFRDGELAPDAIMIDALLAGVDALAAMLDDIHTSGDFPCEDLIGLLASFLESGAGNRQQHKGLSGGDPAPSPFSAEEIEAAARGDHQTLCWVRVPLTGAPGEEPVQPAGILAEMETMGRIAAGRLEGGCSGLADCLEAEPVLHLLYQAMMERTHVAPILEIPEDWVREPLAGELGPDELPEAVPSLPEPLLTEGGEAAEEKSPVASGEAKPGLPEAPPAETIRVRVDLLNKMMNMASELVLARNQLLRALEGESGRSGSLAPLLQNLDLVTSSLQEQIMQTRMQPVGSVFAKIPRLVRSVSQKMGKRITVEISGSEVELDKSIVEALSDPVTHLIRNCCDHGLEAGEERLRAGKPETGTIRVEAFHESGLVHIAISDDGRGIDPAGVAAKAVAKGLVSPAALERMSLQEQLQLIFLPGLSTAATVSEISGRGVGMDVVKNNIGNLGGHVELASTTGRGTRVVLKLPLTLAIIPSLIVRVADQRFALPQVNLIELVRVSAGEYRQKLERIGDLDVLRLRGHLLPLVSLREILRMDGERSGEEINILVLRLGANRYGLVVDEVFQVVEIVVKPLSRYLKTSQCFAGATILDDGRVAMILDAMGIALQARLSFGELSQEQAPAEVLPAGAAARQAVLLFTNHPEEVFAMPLAAIARLEPLAFSSIKRIGDREFLDYRGTVLPLIRLEDYLPVRPLPQERREGFVVIPKLGDDKAGLVAADIIDSAQVEISLDETSFSGYGCAGTAIIDGRVTVFLDPEELFSVTGGRSDTMAWDAII